MDKKAVLSSVKFMIEQVQFLASNYSEQRKELEILEDYATIDLASEWIWNDTKNTVEYLMKNGAISQESSDLIKEICSEFGRMVKNPELCTLDAWEKSVFWKEQRDRAKKLLIELKYKYDQLLIQ